MSSGPGRLVVIDARGYFTGGGIGRYTRGLVRELAALPPAGARFRLLISNQHAPHEVVLPAGHAMDVVISRAGWMNPVEEDRFLESEAAGADVFHSLSGHWLPHAGASIATLHDLTPIVHPTLVSDGARRHGARVLSAIGRASHLVAVSSCTARDARSALAPRVPPITVIPEAADPVFRLSDTGSREADPTRALGRLGLAADEFILAVSVVTGHKNLPRLVDAYAESSVGAPLAIVGALREGTDDLREAIARHGLDERVRLLGRVSDEELAALYRACRMFVYPSLYEGFGLPVLEAMACGAAVITSSTSSLPEVAGDAALLVEPSQSSALAAAMRRLDWDDARREELQRRGVVRARSFSWARTAAATMAVYKGSDPSSKYLGSDPGAGCAA